jgi:hypothetical protein
MNPIERKPRTSVRTAAVRASCVAVAFTVAVGAAPGLTGRLAAQPAAGTMAVAPEPLEGGMRTATLAPRRGAITIEAAGGRTEYDLSGVGNRNFGALRARVHVLPWLAVEPGLVHMRYRDQFWPAAGRWSLWLPEVQAQAELPFGRVRPYVGAGGGAVFASLDSERVTDATLSVAGGARVELGAGWGVGSELRVRALDPFHGTMADLGVSLSRRIR